MERTSSQNWFCPKCTCSWTRAAQCSRSRRPLCGNLENYGGKNVCARFGPFHYNWPEPAFFGWAEQTNGNRPKTLLDGIVKDYAFLIRDFFTLRRNTFFTRKKESQIRFCSEIAIKSFFSFSYSIAIVTTVMIRLIIVTLLPHTW